MATPKGYWISNSAIADRAGILRYRAANRDVMPRYGATFLVMHGPQTVVEPPYRTKQVVVEFPSYQAALDCFNTPAYSAAAQLRHALAAGAMVMVEGYDGPQGLDLLRRPAKRPGPSRQRAKRPWLRAAAAGAAQPLGAIANGKAGPFRR